MVRGALAGRQTLPFISRTAFSRPPTSASQVGSGPPSAHRNQPPAGAMSFPPPTPSAALHGAGSQPRALRVRGAEADLPPLTLKVRAKVAALGAKWGWHFRRYRRSPRLGAGLKVQAGWGLGGPRGPGPETQGCAAGPIQARPRSVTHSLPERGQRRGGLGRVRVVKLPRLAPTASFVISLSFQRRRRPGSRETKRPKGDFSQREVVGALQV